MSAQPGLPGRQPEEEGKAEQYPENPVDSENM